MFPQPIRHRRARRTDFDAIREILLASALPDLNSQRGGRRRFRNLVADLGADLYLAEIDGRVQGLVHITYSRHLLGETRARIELLAVAPAVRGRGAGRSLLALAAARARKRGCAALRCAIAADSDGGRFLAHTGWQIRGAALEFALGELAH